MEEKSNYFLIAMISIVAVVAIVGLVGMFANKGSSTLVVPSAERNMAGLEGYDDGGKKCFTFYDGSATQDGYNRCMDDQCSDRTNGDGPCYLGYISCRKWCNCCVEIPSEELLLN